MLTKPGLREHYLERRRLALYSDIYEPDADWFPRDCCEEHDTRSIPYSVGGSRHYGNMFEDLLLLIGSYTLKLFHQ